MEFFAGAGNIHRVMRAAGHKAVRFDILDGKQRPGTNFMDLQTDAGFALLAHSLLSCAKTLSPIAYMIYISIPNLIGPGLQSYLSSNARRHWCTSASSAARSV